MFLYLQESKRMKYDPRGLLADCLSPNMLVEQQDVDEFFRVRKETKKQANAHLRGRTEKQKKNVNLKRTKKASKIFLFFF